MLSSGSGQRVAMACGLLLFAPGWVAMSPRGLAQDAAPREKDASGKWFPLFRRHASEYVVRVGPDARDEARMLPEPVLRWSQPVRGGDDGALYLWVHEEKPVLAMTFFTFKWPNGTRSIVHERHSLTLEPVEATWRGNPAWHIAQPGLVFKPIPSAPVPASTDSARLRQMQALVREFSANTIDDKASKWPLRPLVKPLYRYEGKRDGALFGMVQGTDPEAFILLEARGEGKDAHWEYAVTRFTDLELHVRLKDREVFSGPHTLGQANEIYHSPTVLSKPSDSPEDFH